MLCPHRRVMPPCPPPWALQWSWAAGGALPRGWLLCPCPHAQRSGRTLCMAHGGSQGCSSHPGVSGGGLWGVPKCAGALGEPETGEQVGTAVWGPWWEPSQLCPLSRGTASQGPARVAERGQSAAQRRLWFGFVFSSRSRVQSASGDTHIWGHLPRHRYCLGTGNPSGTVPKGVLHLQPPAHTRRAPAEGLQYPPNLEVHHCLGVTPWVGAGGDTGGSWGARCLSRAPLQDMGRGSGRSVGLSPPVQPLCPHRSDQPALCGDQGAL